MAPEPASAERTRPAAPARRPALRATHAPWTGDPGSATVAGSSDAGTRITVMRAFNDAAGNRAATEVARAARTVQRDDGDDPYEEETSGHALANARFAGNRRLQEIADGGKALSRSDPAAAVKPVQTALLDLGYSLLRYKDDGSFGDETSQAIAQFRADRSVTAGDGMDANALRRLDALAPAAGVQEEHELDYGRLFEDGRLDVTLSIGYDEDQTHFADLDSARAWMARMKLTRTSAPAPVPEPAPAAGDTGAGEAPAPDPNADTRKGISTPEVYQGTRTVTYPDATGARVSKSIAVTITLVPPGTGGKQAFAKGLDQSEVSLYSGHARRGIGPDFDKDKSPYENFVIGVGSALHKQGRVQAAGAVAESHYVIDKKNDLEAMRDHWDPERYRVWFFNACSSIAYMDELRGGLLPEQMDRHNLDLFGTNTEVPIAAGLAPVFANLEGILEGQTMEEIVRRMQASTLEALGRVLDEKGYTGARRERVLKKYEANMFEREGAGDNPVAAP